MIGLLAATSGCKQNDDESEATHHVCTIQVASWMPILRPDLFFQVCRFEASGQFLGV